MAPVCNHCNVPLTILHNAQKCTIFDAEHKTFHPSGTLRGTLGHIRDKISNALEFLLNMGVGYFIYFRFISF
jgi:hypothetical protein